MPPRARPKPKPARCSSAFDAPPARIPAALPPARIHAPVYHYAQLLQDGAACAALLRWFGGVEESRSMPWRQRWVDPKAYEGREAQWSEVVMRRAYEVWVSEVSKCGWSFGLDGAWVARGHVV